MWRLAPPWFIVDRSDVCVGAEELAEFCSVEEKGINVDVLLARATAL